MTLFVSQGTAPAHVDGQKACARGCGRPRDRKGQRYCRPCHAEYMRGWRRARTELFWQLRDQAARQ